MAVHHLIKKIKETGSKERLKGKGRPVTAITEENASIFEELLCSQEDEPGTHNSIRQIALRISPKSPDCNPLDYYFWDCVQEVLVILSERLMS